MTSTTPVNNCRFYLDHEAGLKAEREGTMTSTGYRHLPWETLSHCKVIAAKKLGMSYSSGMYFEAKYLPSARKFFRERVREFGLEPSNTTINLRIKNLSFPFNRVEVCDSILQGEAKRYKAEYGIDIDIISGIRGKKGSQNFIKILSEMEKDSYRGFMLLDTHSTETDPVLVYKRKDEKFEIFMISRGIKRRGDCGPGTLDVVIMQEFTKAKLSYHTFTIAHTASDPYDHADSVGNFLVLRNALIDLKERRKNGEQGFDGVLKTLSTSVQFKTGESTMFQVSEVPPQWNYTDENFDESNGRDRCTAVHVMYSETIVKYKAALKAGLLEKTTIAGDLFSLVESYFIDCTIGKFRAMNSRLVTLSHSITYIDSVTRAEQNKEDKKPRMVCVYSLFKAYKVAGFPAPVDATVPKASQIVISNNKAD